ETNKLNTKAVCICCINKNGGLEVVQYILSYFIANRARLCQAHLAGYDNFKNTYTEEVQNILSQLIPEDNKHDSNTEDEDTSEEETESYPSLAKK
ncbi:6184_t:CDS:2, partial [Funneliformis geosporum]